jgi:acetyl esterase/lipase
MTETMPPAIIFCGGKDPISYPYGVKYANAINEGGGYAVVHVYEEQPHIFSGVYPDMHEKTGVFWRILYVNLIIQIGIILFKSKDNFAFESGFIKLV